MLSFDQVNRFVLIFKSCFQNQIIYKALNLISPNSIISDTSNNTTREINISINQTNSVVGENLGRPFKLRAIRTRQEQELRQ